MTRFVAICVGGAIGTAARYLITGWLPMLLGIGFPYGTLAVNLIGSFSIGLIMEVALKTSVIGPTLRLTLTTGFLGGLTTYSTFNYETVRFLREGAALMGLMNLGAMTLACLAGGFAGILLAQWWVGGA